MRHPDRRTKIVCTLGPAVSSLESIIKLIECGMDVARLNFSHGTHEQHLVSIKNIREASKQLRIPVAILADLQGPKIRNGRLLRADGTSTSALEIAPQMSLWFCGVDVGATPKSGSGSKETPITISYPRLAFDLKTGDKVMFDDGLVRMTVKSTLSAENLVELVVDNGTTLGENKGVNMPGARLSTLGITEKDWDDAQFATREGVDFLALSFVRSSREVKSLKTFVEQKKLGVHIIAKIEKAEAVDNIDDILFWSDGIMVARGDLGVEIGNEKVPLIQKLLIRKARSAGKPVITATQMLMSMVSNPSPSRAEASDVANAVFDGSDALMLSNETATGQFPFDSVQTMSNIILGAETIPARDDAVKSLKEYVAEGKRLPTSEAIEAVATTLASGLGAKCLACLTRSGQAARHLAKYRPPMPIYAFTESEKVEHQLCLAWGVSIIRWQEIPQMGHAAFDEMLAELIRISALLPGELAVITAGIPTSMQIGSTNTVVVKKAPEKTSHK